VEVQWKDAWPGAALSAALFVAGKYGLALYFHFASTAPFGAAGSLAATLIWVYYSAALVFFGAAFTRAYAERHGKSVPLDRYGARATGDDSCDINGGSHPQKLANSPQPVTS
jgi:membrane protein